ncbi:MAG: tetratricopeptide repeat protein [Gammaproteobacteria bacterium]|nr:tetratricopeptide repeat protein [Gammaproteobacteria bacterium]MDE2346850.1 tetratricopeptide repeat protein [Gammaproteobacteria bacterium]
MDTKSGKDFIDRLKRHYMVRIAAVYAIAGWVIIQLFNNILPNLGIAKDSVRFAIIIVALGFPVMLVLAWTFTNPSGEKYVEPSSWTRLRLRIGSVLSLVIIIIVGISGWYLWRLAVIAHVAAEVASSAPVVTAPPFNPQPRTIAVLPFKNLNNNPKQQYFSDGITEEITGALGALPGVRVISWQSASAYRWQKISPTAAGKALNVANVLIGSVRRDGDRIRISTELVNSVNGFQLWSAHYDRTFSDIFAIQDSISKAMVEALQLHLANDQPLVTAATTSTDAHDLYLQGLEAMNMRTVEGLDAAIKFFQRAIRKDHHFAQAYAALALAYALTHQYTNIPLKTSLPLAERAAKQALRLNSKLSDAHLAMGAVYISQEKIERGQKELRRAMELNPNNLEAHVIYADTLPKSKAKQALVHFQQAAVLDPNSYTAHYGLGYEYETLGDYKNAVTEFQAAIALAPQLASTRVDLAGLYHRNSDDKSAVDILTGVQTDDPLQAQIINAARLAYMDQQNPQLGGQAIAALQQIDLHQVSYNDKAELVTLYALVGMKQQAVQLLAQVCDNAPETCGDIAINASYGMLRGMPGFDALVKKYAVAE